MKKIALVDDDVDFSEATKLLLQSKGYEVVLAHDGKEGLDMIRSERPDLIILDVMMPEMNGYDVCVVLKEDEALKDIPVILLTAVDQAFFRTTYSKHMGLMTEADEYIAKPVASEDLVACVESFMREA
jgi:two-component system alkaline phosphatase synthesis response regulator PhoP